MSSFFFFNYNILIKTIYYRYVRLDIISWRSGMKWNIMKLCQIFLSCHLHTRYSWPINSNTERFMNNKISKKPDIKSMNYNFQTNTISINIPLTYFRYWNIYSKCSFHSNSIECNKARNSSETFTFSRHMIWYPCHTQYTSILIISMV